MKFLCLTCDLWNFDWPDAQTHNVNHPDHEIRDTLGRIRLGEPAPGTGKYMIVWWLAPTPGSIMTPYYAIFDDAKKAIDAAKTRNALLISWAGGEPTVRDYKYRDKDGEPMPAVIRVLFAPPRGGLATLRYPI